MKQLFASTLTVDRFRANDQVAVRSAVHDIAFQAGRRYIEVLSQSLLDLSVAHVCGYRDLSFGHIVRATLVSNVNNNFLLSLAVL